MNQLHGGVLEYVRQIKKEGLESRFLGKNFVFDERLGEKITDDVIAKCHQCGKPADTHTNCKNDACHLLFIQCAECAQSFDGCCTTACKDIYHLPIEEQEKLRAGQKNGIQVTDAGKSFIRNICMAFDLLLQRKTPDVQLFSMTV